MTRAKSRYILDGIVPILQTPFEEDGTLDTASLRRLVDHVIQAGAVGVICPAVASEVHKLSPDERRAMLEIVLDQAQERVPVFVGVSAGSAEESLALSRHARARGVSGILAQAPEGIAAGLVGRVLELERGLG
ncbi:MAG: dihydrodipicolinate synthase family protein [candidate division NC10 bacterium]|nr:dihydrodipicolinate synthase family protein [candidate division NC10 bacterium]MBI4842267.1 dihydrodipicolinate synthase family protein [candidate division NC10 bacterium]